MSKCNHSCGSNDKAEGCGCQSGSTCKCGSKETNGCSCCSGGGKCNCSCHQSCGSQTCKGHEGGFAHELLDLADQAWMEVLKEKIKENIRSGCCDHLNELAALVTETNKNRWKNKMAKKQNCEQFAERLKEIFKNKQNGNNNSL